MLAICVAVVVGLALVGALQGASSGHRAGPAVRRAVLRSVDIARGGIENRALQVTSDLQPLEPCDFLTAGFRRHIVHVFHGLDDGRLNCETILPLLGDQAFSASTTRAYRTATVDGVTQRGDTATVTFHGGLAAFGLQRIGGRWLVDHIPID